MKEIFGDGGKLSAGLEGFEAREGQQHMAEAVAETLATGSAGEDGRAAVL